MISQLNAKFQSKVVPCFGNDLKYFYSLHDKQLLRTPNNEICDKGFHPWFAYLLSLENDPPENETHYRSVLNDIGPKNSINCNI
ncbi:22145_t:CDS:1, partial [Racocetra persica]